MVKDCAALLVTVAGGKYVGAAEVARAMEASLKSYSLLLALSLHRTLFSAGNGELFMGLWGHIQYPIASGRLLHAPEPRHPGEQAAEATTEEPRQTSCGVLLSLLLHTAESVGSQ
jgi:hypothetical protein